MLGLMTNAKINDISVFWNMTYCSPVKLTQRFGGKWLATEYERSVRRKISERRIFTTAAVKTPNTTFKFISQYFSHLQKFPAYRIIVELSRKEEIWLHDLKC
jgi:hypothetical protein